MIPGQSSISRVARVGAAGGAGRLWTPADIGADLTAWFDADAGLTMNGGKVSQWAPRAGTAAASLLLTQGNAGGQPTLTTVDGFNALAFGGYQYFDMPAAQMPSLLPGFVLMLAVVRPDASTSNVYGKNVRWGPDTNSGFLISNFTTYGFTSNTTSYSGATQDNGAAFFSYQWFRNGAPGYEGNGTVATYNGVPQARSVVVNTGTNTYNSGQGMFGNIDGYAPAGSEWRYVAWAVCKASSMTSEVIAKWEGYYAAKMNALARLPANHPYKSALPRV